MEIDLRNCISELKNALAKLEMRVDYRLADDGVYLIYIEKCFLFIVSITLKNIKIKERIFYINDLIANDVSNISLSFLQNIEDISKYILHRVSCRLLSLRKLYLTYRKFSNYLSNPKLNLSLSILSSSDKFLQFIKVQDFHSSFSGDECFDIPESYKKLLKLLRADTSEELIMSVRSSIFYSYQSNFDYFNLKVNIRINIRSKINSSFNYTVEIDKDKVLVRNLNSSKPYFMDIKDLSELEPKKLYVCILNNFIETQDNGYK